MKASTLSSLLSSKAVNLFHPSSYHPRSFQSSKFFFTPLPCFSPATRYHNRIHLTRKLQFHTASPRKSRAPPAIAMPTPPVIPDKERNIAHVRKAIEEAAEKGAQLFLLPDIEAGGDPSPSTAMLSEDSRLLKITIVGGSIPERYEGRLYNTCCVFGTDGKLKAKHGKV